MKFSNSPSSQKSRFIKNLESTFLSALVLIAFTGSLQEERTEFLYVSHSYAKGLLSFSVDDETGKLTALPSYLLTEGVGSLAYDHRNRVLYNGGYNGVGAYRVKEDGLLQALPRFTV